MEQVINTRDKRDFDRSVIHLFGSTILMVRLDSAKVRLTPTQRIYMATVIPLVVIPPVLSV